MTDMEQSVLEKHGLLQRVVHPRCWQDLDSLLAVPYTRPRAVIISAIHSGTTFDFGGGCRIRDDDVVACFVGRGALQCGPSHGIEFVFVNCCGTAEVAQRLHRECGIPVVMGWRDVTVPAQQCLSMSFMFLRLLSLGLTYDGALADATTVCKRLCRVDTLSVDLLRPTSAWFSEELGRPKGFMAGALVPVVQPAVHAASVLAGADAAGA